VKFRIDLPSDPVGTIYADPPWEYDNPRYYDRMTLEDIKDIPIRDMECEHLWLWTTNTYLPRSLEVVEAWGFEYRSMLTWVKNRMGTGWWLRNKTEHVLFATRSKDKRATPRSRTTVLHEDWQPENRKPDIVYDIIEELSPGPYLELFATKAHPGWQSLSAPAPPLKKPYPRLKRDRRPDAPRRAQGSG
jgi:N6-adenosine-specific RNA methylase IME4